jgi:hypothetical protein
MDAQIQEQKCKGKKGGGVGKGEGGTSKILYFSLKLFFYKNLLKYYLKQVVVLKFQYSTSSQEVIYECKNLKI